MNPLESISESDQSKKITLSLLQSTIIILSFLIIPTTKRIRISNSQHSFLFDHVFDQFQDNFQVFSKETKPIIQSAFQGANASIFMFGSTGSGKTFTMLGDKKSNLANIHINHQQDIKNALKQGKYNDIGILIYSMMEILKEINKDSHRLYQLQAQYFEIYNENVYDLLGDVQQNLHLFTDDQNEFQIRNIQTINVTSLQEIIQLIQSGEANRHYAQTCLNHNSSRSHTIFKLIMNTELQVQNHIIQKQNWINFIDLAGNEKLNNQNINSFEKNRLKESQNINKSLFFLTQIIGLLAQNQPNQHIPFRNSILTKLLRSSLIGQYKTLLILCITPSLNQVEQSLTTIKFGENSKLIEKKQCEKKSPNNINELGNVIQNLTIKMEEQELYIEQKNQQIVDFEEQVTQLTIQVQQLAEQLNEKTKQLELAFITLQNLDSKRGDQSDRVIINNPIKSTELVKGQDLKMKTLQIQNLQYKQLIYTLQQRIKQQRAPTIKNQTSYLSLQEILKPLEKYDYSNIKENDQLQIIISKLDKIAHNIKEEIQIRQKIKIKRIHTDYEKDDNQLLSNGEFLKKDYFNNMIPTFNFQENYDIEASYPFKTSSKNEKQKQQCKSLSPSKSREKSNNHSNSPKSNKDQIVKVKQKSLNMRTNQNLEEYKGIRNYNENMEQNENREHQDMYSLSERLLQISREFCDRSVDNLGFENDMIIYERESEQNNSF